MKLPSSDCVLTPGGPDKNHQDTIKKDKTMHGLATLQKLNEAAGQIWQRRSEAPVAAIVGGLYVFEPSNDPEVGYHTENRIPENGRPLVYVEFNGLDELHQPRFRVIPLVGEYLNYATFEEAVAHAALLGAPKEDLAGRLSRRVNIFLKEIARPFQDRATETAEAV